MPRPNPGHEWGALGTPVPHSGPAELLHLVETDVAILRHGFYRKGARVARHRHDCPTLVYGVGGPCVEASDTSGSVKRRLTYHPAGYAHALHYLGDTHVLSIEIKPAVDASLDWPSVSAALPATAYDRVWRVIIDIAGHAPPATVDASLQGLVEAAVGFARAPPSPLVLALIGELHNHWEKIPSVDQLSRKYSLSKQYICRVFKKAMGVTLQRYAVIVRLDYARGLLWSTDRPIAEIAAETGFADQSHLTRALTEHSARTPLRLRWMAPCRDDFPGAWGSRAFEDTRQSSATAGRRPFGA
jgi:AraC-like DNA-binding protein